MAVQGGNLSSLQGSTPVLYLVSATDDSIITRCALPFDSTSAHVDDEPAGEVVRQATEQRIAGVVTVGHLQTPQCHTVVHRANIGARTSLTFVSTEC